jgi:hypothetical protein
MSSILKKYINDDLYNELRWMLVAASEWAAYDELVDNRKVMKPTDFPRHLKVFTMDTTYLHARSLYEFFTATRVRAEQRYWKDYGLTSGLTSPTYTNPGFRGDVHARTMHLGKGRSSVTPVKDDVVVIARDVLDLWDRFSAMPEVASYLPEITKARAMAIEDSVKTAEQYKRQGFIALFS